MRETTRLCVHELPDGSELRRGILPEELIPDSAGFEALWALHPAGYHVIQMRGRQDWLIAHLMKSLGTPTNLCPKQLIWSKSKNQSNARKSLLIFLLRLNLANR